MENVAQPVAETKATQFGRFLRSIIDAAAIVFDRLGAKECIDAVSEKTQKLADYLILVITALKTGQELALVEALTETEQSTPEPEVVEDLGWIELDPAVSFPDRIKACDFMGGVHPNITVDKSKLKRKVRRHIVLYSGPGSTEEMRRRIRANGDRPCDVDDGTGIGKTFPQRQVDNPLVLLDKGSVCLVGDRDQCAPVLLDWGREREFDLLRLAGDWRDNYRFPAVREEEFLDT